MGERTGIGWTDSTYNSWWGCTKVGPACDDCYAEVQDANAAKMKTSDHVTHWGHGAPRRLLSEHARNEPYRWQRNADKFFAKHGRRQRVFTLSMGDLFDHEVPDEWRLDHFRTMRECDQLEWQICTKRISNLPKMVPSAWETVWPRNVGVLITVVTQKEADRDIPRLLTAMGYLDIPWVGISYEPAQEGIDFRPFLLPRGSGVLEEKRLSWIIFGGKSGPNWNDRPFDIRWAYDTRDQCAAAGVAFFMKQVAGFRPTDAMIPPDLLVRQWPKARGA